MKLLSQAHHPIEVPLVQRKAEFELVGVEVAVSEVAQGAGGEGEDAGPGAGEEGEGEGEFFCVDWEEPGVSAAGDVVRAGEEEKGRGVEGVGAQAGAAPFEEVEEVEGAEG